MRIEGDYTFHAPRPVVYELLQDPDVLERAMPGATTLTQVSDDVYEAQVDVKVGSIGGSYSGTVEVRDKRYPEHFVLLVEGQGATGFLKGEGTIDLEEVEEGTLIRYAGRTQVGGRIAQVGQRMVQAVARKLIGQGLQSLEEQLQERQEGGNREIEVE
ncbi:MAG: carbon monoxide dehydrogenase subunit G [Chloroflexota bacterium]|nr:carbon monoxide dehydrogenase subunit G [Chloroflexota bacterium]